MSAPPRLGVWLDNAWDYGRFVALALAAGVLFGHAFGAWIGVAVAASFLLACVGVHWLAHRIVRAARVSKVPQRRLTERRE